MKRVWIVLAMALPVVAWLGCSDDPVKPPDNGGGGGSKLTCDSIAGAWFENLGDALQAMEKFSNDELRNTRFDDIRAGFEQALSCQANHPVASLGLSIVEFLELNYDEDLWALVDSIDAWAGGTSVPPVFSLSTADRRHTLAGRQFELMVEMPVVVAMRMASIPSNITFDNIQQIIADAVIPRLDTAIARMDAVEANPATRFEICMGEPTFQECTVIDMGEIRVFSASLRALRAAFYSMIAYDVDLFGPDGTYDWLEDIIGTLFVPFGTWCATGYEVVELGAIDDLNLYYEDKYSKASALADSILFRVLHHNFENRAGFLSLRDNGEALAAAHADILGTMDKLTAAAEFIRNRTNESEANLIKLTDLTGLDADLGDPYGPNFAKDWTQVEDVFAFVDNLMSGEVVFNEEISPGVNYSWRMDLGRLFTEPVASWKDLLPYHGWNLPTGDWINRGTVLRWEYDAGGGSWWFEYWNGDHCDYLQLMNIGTVREYNVRWSFDGDNVILLLDGPGGNPIDPSVEFPYFPDYTLNGLFPGMTRSSWIDLMALLN